MPDVRCACRRPRGGRRCATRCASPPLAGCSSRSPGPRRSTGSRAWPPGWSAPATRRSRSSPTRTPWSAATACRPGSSAVPRCSPARCRRSSSARAPLPAPAGATSGWRAAGRHVRAGALLPRRPLIAASGHAVGALAVYDPEPRDWTDDAAELLAQLAASVVAELELSAAQSAVGTSPPGWRSPWRPLDRHLGARPAHRRHLLGRAVRGDVRPGGRPPSSLPRPTCSASTCIPTTTRPSARRCGRHRGRAASSPWRPARCDGRPVRWTVSRGG